jgi:hypothetical protein
VAVTSATPMTGHSRVVGSASSLTHLRVRALTCSPSPWTDLAMGAAAYAMGAAADAIGAAADARAAAAPSAGLAMSGATGFE